VKGNDRADTQAVKATLTNGLLLGRSEMLRSLKHYMRAQIQGQHSIDHLEEKGVERGSATRSSLKSDWNCFKGNETAERQGGAHMGFSERIDTILD